MNRLLSATADRFTESELTAALAIVGVGHFLALYSLSTQGFQFTPAFGAAVVVELAGAGFLFVRGRSR